jgi:acyl-CoA reductase-like NAD-dependent aldehyde dehydrogenase
VIVTALIVFAGQFCMSGSRVLVQRGVAESERRAIHGAPTNDPQSTNVTEKTT